MDTTTFGERLKRLREQAGFGNRSEFARAVGLTPKTIELYETGQIASPKYATAIRLSVALGCSADELMGGAE